MGPQLRAQCSATPIISSTVRWPLRLLHAAQPSRTSLQRSCSSQQQHLNHSCLNAATCSPTLQHTKDHHIRGVCRAAGGGAAAAASPGDDNSSNNLGARLANGLSQILQAHFLPLALLSALLLGVSCPQLGLAAANLQIPTLTTFGIFIIQGLQLRRKEAAAALSATGAISYGLASILLLTPLVGLLLVQLALPLQPPALVLGLGVFCAMPTALSSGITFTQQLGGNVSLALLLTVASNILGIFTMPFILPHIIAAAPLATAATAAGGVSGGAAVLEPLPLLLQLCKTILLPTMIGASIRGFVPGAAGAIDSRKKQLSYLSAALLALVPWMQISKTASQNIGIDAVAVAGVAVAGLCIHGVFLAINASACWLLRLGGPDPVEARNVRRAVLLVSSVKTLPVAVTALGKLTPVLGEAAVGIAVVPCVLAHLGQIIWDSLMVSNMKAADDRAAAAAVAAGKAGDTGEDSSSQHKQQ